MPVPSEISIEVFRGDLNALEKMAHTSWRDEYGISSFPNLYQPEYLRFLFSPIQDKKHLIAAYKGNEIVSFLANLPRKFCFKGQIYRAVLSGLLVTRKQYLRQGLAQAVIEKALVLNEEEKYDFALIYMETGHRSNLLMEKMRKAGHPLEWMKRMYVIARVLDLDGVEASEEMKFWEKMAIKCIGANRLPKKQYFVSLRDYRKEDLPAALSLLNQYCQKISLARYWEKEELEWELDYPDVSKTLIYEKDGQVKGLINYVYHEHIGASTKRWAWINHLSYPGLSRKERGAFINTFLSRMHDEGCVGVIDWTKNYLSLGTFFRNRFFPYFRAVNMFSWTFNSNISLKNIRDCNEVQI